MKDRPESPRDSSAVPFHDEIEALRIERGLSQQEVAEAVGMSLRAYSDFANAKLKRGLQPKNRRALRAFFGIDDPQAAGEPTRESWPVDIRVWLDFVGAFLATMTESEREEFMHEQTRAWLAGQRSRRR